MRRLRATVRAGWIWVSFLAVVVAWIFLVGAESARVLKRWLGVVGAGREAAATLIWNLPGRPLRIQTARIARAASRAVTRAGRSRQSRYRSPESRRGVGMDRGGFVVVIGIGIGTVRRWRQRR